MSPTDALSGVEIAVDDRLPEQEANACMQCISIDEWIKQIALPADRKIPNSISDASKVNTFKILLEVSAVIERFQLAFRVLEYSRKRHAAQKLQENC